MTECLVRGWWLCVNPGDADNRAHPENSFANVLNCSVEKFTSHAIAEQIYVPKGILVGGKAVRAKSHPGLIKADGANGRSSDTNAPLVWMCAGEQPEWSPMAQRSINGYPPVQTPPALLLEILEKNALTTPSQGDSARAAMELSDEDDRDEDEPQEDEDAEDSLTKDPRGRKRRLPLPETIEYRTGLGREVPLTFEEEQLFYDIARRKEKQVGNSTVRLRRFIRGVSASQFTNRLRVI